MHPVLQIMEIYHNIEKPIISHTYNIGWDLKKTQATTTIHNNGNWNNSSPLLLTTPSTHLVFSHPYWSTPQVHRAQLIALENYFLSESSPQWYPTLSGDLTHGWNIFVLQWNCSRTSPLTMPMAYHVEFWIPTACLPKFKPLWTQPQSRWGLVQQTNH